MPSWKDLLGLLCLSVLGAVGYHSVLASSFWSSDDWLHLKLAHGMLLGAPGAWKVPFLGDGPAEAMRLTPYLLFVIDWLVHRADPAGYFATNMGVAWVCMASVFVLLRAFGVGPARASVATLSFIFLPPVQQIIYWIPARDDGCAAAMALLTLASWTQLRNRPNRRWLCWVLYGLAAFGKPPMGLQLLGVLFGLELLCAAKEDAFPRASVARLLPFVAVCAVWCVALWIAVSGRDVGSADMGMAPPEILFLRLTSIVLPAYAYGEGLSSVERVLAAALGAGALVGLVFGRNSKSSTLLRLAGVLCLGSTLPILPWLLRADSAGADQARYLLLTAAATPFLVAAMLEGGAGRGARVWQGALGLILVGCFVASGVPAAKYSLERQLSSSTELIELMSSLEEEHSTASALYLGVRQPDHGVTSLIASPLWAVLFPELPSPIVFVQGSTAVWRKGEEVYGYGWLQRDPATTLDVRDLAEDALLVWQAPTKEGLKWERAAPPSGWPTAPLPVQELPLWSSRHERHYPSSRIYRELQQMGVRMDSLDLPARLEDACTLRFRFSATAGRGEVADGVEDDLLSGGYALGSFGRAKDAFLMPVDPQSHRATLFLPNLAGPPPRGRRMRLLASNQPGRVDLLGLELAPCAAQ
jgi:hypothetical protein